jgi:hypothetical protein
MVGDAWNVGAASSEDGSRASSSHNIFVIRALLDGSRWHRYGALGNSITK